MYAPGFESHRYIGNVEIKPGAVVTHNPQVQLRFAVQVVCKSVNPESWVGRLTFNGRTVAETDTHPTMQIAADAVDKVLDERIGDLFAP